MSIDLETLLWIPRELFKENGVRDDSMDEYIQDG